MNGIEETLKWFLQDYHHRLEKKTLNLYEKAVTHFFQVCPKTVETITSTDIRKWMLELTQQGYAPSTVMTRMCGLKLFFRYCQDEGILTKNPMEQVKYPEIEDSLPHYLEQEELVKLRDYVKDDLTKRTMIEVLYTTGVRISELAKIKQEDINWSERSIRIIGKRKQERIVLFTRSCEKLLQSYLQQRQDANPYLFVNYRATQPVVVRTIQKQFKKYSRELGLRVTPHTLRHTFAAHLAKKGMPFECIQELLGHDTPEQTRRYARLYHHAQKEMYEEWM